MKEKRITALILAVLLLVGGGYCGYRFLKHEKAQNEKINTLQGQVTLLNEKLAGNSEAVEFTSSVGDGFDYLAIGNSITRHGICDCWWGEWGMAASEPSRDYYHKVVEGLEKKHGHINTAVCTGYVWEVQSHDRDETFEILDSWLVPGIDLITVQLSENALDLSTFEKDCESLFLHIREMCGTDCQIIIIDDFWSDEKNVMKKRVAEGLGLCFVDLSDIRGKSEYQAGMETAVSGLDGKEHIIEHSGVAAHPGDEMMKVIAERVLEKLTSR